MLEHVGKLWGQGDSLDITAIGQRQDSAPGQPVLMPRRSLPFMVSFYICKISPLSPAFFPQKYCLPYDWDKNEDLVSFSTRACFISHFIKIHYHTGVVTGML